MSNARGIKSKAESLIRQADPEVIIQGNMYDEASGRLFVTIVKGQRRIELNLPRHYFDNGSGERLNHLIKEGVERLRHTPKG